MDTPEGMDPKMYERTMKRSSIILMLEDLKMMIYGDLADGKLDNTPIHDIIKKALATHEQSYLQFLEKIEQAKGGGKVPTGTKEN